MTIEEIINILINTLPEYIRFNPSFKKILKTYLNVTNIKSETPYFIFEINEKIVDEHDLSNNENINPVTGDSIIFSVFNDKEDTFFTVSKKDDSFIVSFSNSTDLSEEMCEIIEITITFDKDKATWTIHKYICDINDYYNDYQVDIHVYDQKGREIEKNNKENKIDREFSKIFGIPLEDARKYRLNFNKYKDYLNESRINIMKDLENEMFTGDKKLFSVPFDINYLSEFLLDDLSSIDADYEGYEKAESLKENLIRYTGNNGDFTMTLNLVTNIRLFLSGKVKGLNTSGLIIRKIDTEYTAFYISLTKETMCVIPKPLSKEELLEIYTSHEINKHIFSLPEFFGMDKKYKLD